MGFFDAKSPLPGNLARVSSNCPFCQIVAGELPTEKVHETDTVLAFRDLSPQAPTHVLVVPKVHLENAHAVSAQDAGVLTDMLIVAQQVATKQGCAPEGDAGGYRLVMNVGEDAQNSVPHLHMHVLGGRSFEWPPG